jgi:hypothetical protein
MKTLRLHPHPADRRRLRTRVVPVVVAAAALAATAPAGAQDRPSVRSDADVVSPGHRYVLRGEGWFAGPRCGARAQISQREAHGVRVGSARIRDNGTFAFSHAVPREARRGTRIVLDVSQLCDGVGTSRTVRIGIGRDRRGCGRPLAGDGTAYAIAVVGGLGCGLGEEVIGDFIDLGIEPDGWACAHVDRRVADRDYDFACTESARPGRRVEARSVPAV